MANSNDTPVNIHKDVVSLKGSAQHLEKPQKVSGTKDGFSNLENWNLSDRAMSLPESMDIYSDKPETVVESGANFMEDVGTDY